MNESTLPFSVQDTKYMKRALELASRGNGNVAPNPMVGCVVVNNESIIGEGWHEEFGQAHAEVNAINSIERTELLVGATVYVTLEPCSHYGKTPPCADLLADLPIKRIVIATEDPNPAVAGKGKDLLKSRGKVVDLGLLEPEARVLNKRFFVFHQQKRPYIILKWAETEDGFIARENFDSKWISNEYARTLVHKWRTEESAIVVGANTVKHDNPRLTARNWSGRNPTRVVVNPSASLGLDYHIFDGEMNSIIYTRSKEEVSPSYEFRKLGDGNFLNLMMQNLWESNVLSLFVEGGATLLSSFLKANLWDEARVFVGKQKFDRGVRAPIMAGSAISKETLMGDILLTYKN